MRRALLCVAVAVLIFCALPARAADLSKIERVTVKEPKYQGKPIYCLLVFGTEANFRVWLVLDGTTLYVDRNGNGDLTEPDKRVSPYYQIGKGFGFRPGQLATPDGKTKYRLSQLRMGKESCDMTVDGDFGYSRAGFDGPGNLRFSDRAQDAPIIYFHGPLTLQRFDPQPDSASPDCKAGPLVRERHNNLGFSLGTPGLGSGTFAKYGYDGKDKASAEIRFANGKTVTVSLMPDN
jgi:hypothetical protein